MDNKQTIALAGLIKYTDSEQVTSVPFLSKIPILGALFRNKSTPSADTNTEMVIILTPIVLTDKKFADKQVVMPTPLERDGWKEIDAKYEKEALPPWPAPKPAVAPLPGPQGLQPATIAYARQVQEKISRTIMYPPEAIQNSWAGTVKLKLWILRNGALASQEVVQSSGQDVFDKDAVHAAQTASPYGAFTAEMHQEDLIVTIPIVYNKVAAGNRSLAGKVIASY